jgi:hypothetical protein
MKKCLIILLSLFLFLSCKSQSVVYKKIENIELNNFIGSFFESKSFELKESLVKTILVSNPSGSYGNPESDEVSNSIYISNCEYGELLICKLYIAENLIKIKVENVTEEKSSIIIEISSGNFKKRKIDKIIIPK